MKTGQIPIGIKDVQTADNGIYNFLDGKAIGKDIYASAVRDPVSNGYDHIWYVGDNQLDKRYVNLYNPKNKLNLKVQALSDKVTGFILYSNCYPRKGQIMSDGKEDSLYSGITIEPYTYFTNDETGLKNITYDENNPFETSYSYEISLK